MGKIINGRNLILYVPINGYNYPVCHATDCKVVFTSEVQETTTRNSRRGRTYDYTGKYGYTLQLNGITGLSDLPAIAIIESTNTESIDPFNDSNLHYYDSGNVVIELKTSPSSKSYTQIAGSPGTFEAFSEQNGSGTNPLLTQIITKNGVTVFSKSVANVAGANMQYNITADYSAKYTQNVYSEANGVPVPEINIPDTFIGANNGIINVSLFQDAILNATKLPFVFTDNSNVTYTGSVLVTQNQLDSPVDNVSTFSNDLLGDGDITKVVNGVTPIQPGGLGSVYIDDQFGNTLAVVNAPGTFNVTRFDTIDSRGWSNPDIIITA